jgi:8-oxo-dGTP pyrophosphatase MutT (NUDIX family)
LESRDRFWDPTDAGGQPVNLSLYENIIKEAYEEAGVPSDWLCHPLFTDHTEDPLTITTAKPDGSCLKRSIYYSFDLQVSQDWRPTAVDGEVSEFKLYSVPELEEELKYGDSIRPAMRSVLLDFMIRHGLWKESYNGEVEELRKAMRRNRMSLW